MNKFKLNLSVHLLISLILILGGNDNVYADESGDKWNFNGYYSLDLTYADDDLVLVGNSREQHVYDEGEISLGNSILGGQLEYKVSDRFSAFIQGSLYSNNENKVDFNLDWAYLSYDFGHDFSARAGRFQIPFLSGTELRRVGFTRLWARPLIPGNGASGNEYHTGIEFLKKYSRGENNWEFQLATGEAEHALQEIDNHEIHLISAKYQRNNFWLRTSMMYSEFSLSTPRGIPVTDSGHAFLGSLESEWNYDNFQINLGFSDTRTIYVPEDAMAYASVGFHVNDKVTPYIVGVRQNQHFELFSVGGGGGPPGGVPPLIPPPNGDKDSYILGIGARIEVAPKMALKFQLENVREKDATRIQNGIIYSDGTAVTFVLEGIF